MRKGQTSSKNTEKLPEAKSMIEERIKNFKKYEISFLKENIHHSIEVVLEREAEKRDVIILEEVLKNCLSSIEKVSHGTYEVSEISLKLEELRDEIIQIKKVKNKKEKREQTKLNSSKSKLGRKKIDPGISYSILRAIEYCNEYNLKVDWLKDFLSPNKPLYKILEFDFKQLNISMPIPSNDNLYHKNWLYKLKESLQRSILHEGEEKIKKTIDENFLKKRNHLYEKIQKNNTKLRLSIEKGITKLHWPHDMWW